MENSGGKSKVGKKEGWAGKKCNWKKIRVDQNQKVKERLGGTKQGIKRNKLKYIFWEGTSLVAGLYLLLVLLGVSHCPAEGCLPSFAGLVIRKGFQHLEFLFSFVATTKFGQERYMSMQLCFFWCIHFNQTWGKPWKKYNPWKKEGFHPH